jgi:hypothetical protein
LFTKAARGLGVALGISVLTNTIDYTVGENSDKGLGAEFAASTMVDFAVAGSIGLGSAGAVALGVAIVAAAGITAPFWAAAAGAAFLGAGVGFLVDHLVDTDEIKERVADGFQAWRGNWENIKTIAGVGLTRAREGLENFGDRIKTTTTDALQRAEAEIQQTASDVKRGAVKAVEKLADTAHQAAVTIQDSIDHAAETVETGFEKAKDKVGDFLGNLLGGED